MQIPKWVLNKLLGRLPNRLQWELMSIPFLPACAPDPKSEEFWTQGENIANQIEGYLEQEFGFSLTDSKVLEIGCGPGRIAVPIAERGVEMHAIDISTRMLRRCENQASERKVSIKTAKAPDRLVEAEDEFDLIYAHYVFQHIPRREVLNYLKLSRKALRQGGAVYFTFPRLESENKQEELLSSLDQTYDFRMRYYTAEEIKLYMNMCGFENVRLVDNDGQWVVISLL